MSTSHPVVLVHGNPETTDVWTPMLAHLDLADVRLESPPGFGVAPPEGWQARMSDYVEWLIARIVSVGRPVHLVGHDWGGIISAALAITRPELLRSWTTDCIGLFHPDYVWHEWAIEWQTPGIGEQRVDEQFGGTPQQRTTSLLGFGIPPQMAEIWGPAEYEHLGRDIILPLYRSAAQPVLSDIGRDIANAATVPGLSILATRDEALGPESLRREAAQLAGAEVEAIDAGHWWMVDRPEQSAAALDRFWTRADADRT